MEANKERNYSIDMMRIFASFMLVVFHAASYIKADTGVSDFDRAAVSGYMTAICFPVPLFLMISGLFFLDTGKALSVGKIYKKYMFRLLTAYVFWSLVYAVYEVALSGDPVSVSVLKAVLMLARDSHYHLWYLPYLCGIYILLPLLRGAVGGNQRNLQYGCLVFFVFGILQKSLLLIDLPFDTWEIVMKKISVPFFTTIAGYYLWGYYISNRQWGRKTRSVIYAGAVLSLFASAFSDIRRNLEMNQGEVQIWAGNYMSLTSFLIITAIFCFFFFEVSRISLSEGMKKRVCRISECTFGIYLIHDLSLCLLEQAGLKPNSIMPVFGIPVMAGAAFILSYLIVLSVKRIPVLSRYIV